MAVSWWSAAGCLDGSRDLPGRGARPRRTDRGHGADSPARVAAPLHVAILDLTGQAGEAVVGLEVPAGVAGLPVVLAQGACEEVELLPGRQDGLGDLARVEALVDSCRASGHALPGRRPERARPGRRVLTVKLGRCRPRKAPRAIPARRTRTIGGETTAWFTWSRSDNCVGTTYEPHAADQGSPMKPRDFSPISTELEMISHTNPTR